MQTVWEILQGLGKGRKPRRRSGSQIAGHEGAFWQPFNPKDKSRFMFAAERYERMTRQKGKRSGKLGHVALEVLRDLLRLIDHKTGRLEPSIASICQRIRRSRDAVVRALAALRDAGFVSWIRRYVPTGHKGRGVQVEQTSNAYKLTLPKLAAQMIDKVFGTPPIPADAEHHDQEQRTAVRTMINSLPLWEQPAQIVEDIGLAQALSSLGRSIAERESAKQAETTLNINY